MKIVSSATLAVMIMLATALAHAESPLTLEWVAPLECPTQADVIADVGKRLGGSSSGVPVLARAAVTRTHDAWQVVLSTNQRGVIGERTLVGATCAAVASAAALILALTIDPEALAHVTAPPPPTRPSPPPPPPPRPPDIERRREPRHFARVAPVVGFGVLANVASPGVSFAFGAYFQRLSVELVTTAFFPESGSADAKPDAGANAWLLAVGGHVCAAAVDALAVRFGACAGFEVQGIHASGYGVSNPNAAVAGWGAPIGALALDAHLVAALWFSTRVEAAFPLDRPRFVLDGVGPVFAVNPVTLRASAGVTLRF